MSAVTALARSLATLASFVADLPDDEALLARDVIWPSMRQHVLPGMIDGLVREISREVATLDAQDRALVAESLDNIWTEAGLPSVKPALMAVAG